MDVGRGDRVAAVAVIDMEREFGTGEELPTGASAQAELPLEVRPAKKAAPMPSALDSQNGSSADGETE